MEGDSRLIDMHEDRQTNYLSSHQCPNDQTFQSIKLFPVINIACPGYARKGEETCI